MEWQELCDEVEAEHRRRLEVLELVRVVVPSPEGLCWQHPNRFARFLELIEPQEDGCWEFIGSEKGGGYGQFSLFGISRPAHIVSYLFFKGRYDLPVIRHLCLKRICVHPNHLMAGTHSDNLLDCTPLNRSLRAHVYDIALIKVIRGIKIAEPWRSAPDVADQLNVSVDMVRDIWRGRTWSSIEGHTLPPERPKLVRRM